MNKKLTLLLLIVLTLLLFGCNTENEGIFTRISNSVEKDDVGWVDLIAIHSDTIYAMTQYKGFASYDGNWKKIDISTKKIGNYTYNSTANKIFFITDDGANAYIYDLDSTTSSPSVIDLADKEILSSSHYNFVLVKEDDNSYTVYEFDGSDFTNEVNLGSDLTSAQLIASDDSNWIVSEATSAYYNDNTEITIPNPIIAMGVNALDDVITIDSEGNIYTYDDIEKEFNKVDGSSITLFERTSDNLPYPSFVYNGSLYIQNGSYDIYSIKIDDGELTKEDGKFSDISKPSIRIKSYLLDGSTLYLGTYANGIMEITL